MHDYLLRASDEAALWARLAQGSVRRSRMEWQDEGALLVTGLVAEQPDMIGTLIKAPVGGTALDVIGTIYRSTGAMLTDSGGLSYPEMVPVPGFHANLRTNEPLTDAQLALLPLVTPPPATPDRVWA